MPTRIAIQAHQATTPGRAGASNLALSQRLDREHEPKPSQSTYAPVVPPRKGEHHTLHTGFPGRIDETGPAGPGRHDAASACGGPADRLGPVHGSGVVVPLRDTGSWNRLSESERRAYSGVPCVLQSCRTDVAGLPPPVFNPGASTRTARHGDTKPAIHLASAPVTRAGSLLSITSQRQARSPTGHRWQRCKGTDAWISSGCSTTGNN